LLDNGLIASLARPGGNVTGLTTMTNELTLTHLELLREALPTVTRVAVLQGLSAYSKSKESVRTTIDESLITL